ncbi:MAG: glycosyltransferase family 2 protein [Helicobacteraceae bacterium]
MPSLSVALISFNEEKNLARTLEAVRDLADEIVVLDSNSKDATKSIAQSFGAKFSSQEFKGHIEQKNDALALCTGDWILSLDCDEVVTPELKNSIRAVLAKDDRNTGYQINRKSFYKGKILEHAWQKDIKFRLFAREKNARWGGYNPHDVLLCDLRLELLNGELIHYSYENVSDHFMRTVKYARIAAQSYHKMGKKFRLYKLLFSPIFSFCKDYIFKLGVLDGLRGFIAGVSAFVYVFLKYVFLWETEYDEQA